jgi:predicted nucleic acid-binding protein
MILVDSCVLIDIIEQDALWLDWSMSQIEQLRMSGDLKANIVVYAELAKSFAASDELDEFMRDMGVSVEHIPRVAAHQAAHAHLAYRRNRGGRASALPDFFIGAHAQAMGWQILTRDRSRFRTYFPSVRLIAPE